MNDPVVVEKQAQVALLNLGVPGLTNLKMDLYSNTFEPTGDNDPLAAFTAPTYTGYAQASPAFSAAYVDQPTGKAASVTGQAVFNGPTSGPGSQIYGWYIWDHTNNIVWMAGSFSGGPLSLQNPTDKLVLTIQLLGVDGGDAVSLT